MKDFFLRKMLNFCVEKIDFRWTSSRFMDENSQFIMKISMRIYIENEVYIRFKSQFPNW